MSEEHTYSEGFDAGYKDAVNKYDIALYIYMLGKAFTEGYIDGYEAYLQVQADDMEMK